MKKLLILLLILFTSTFVFAQSKGKSKKSKPTTAIIMLQNVKKLTTNQKSIYLNTLKRLDAADTEFAINKDGNTYFSNVLKAQVFFVENNAKVPEGKLKEGFNLLLLNYLDSITLIKFSMIRSNNGGSIKLTDDEITNLGEIQRRYSRLIGIGINDDLLHPDIVEKIYSSALSLKKGMYSFFD